MAKKPKKKAEALPEKKEEALPAKLGMLPEMNMQDLIAKAIDQNSALEVLDRLCGMRDRLKAETAEETYFRALAAFQAECPAIKKAKKVKDKRGKHRYSYAPLEDIVAAVREPLEKHGFSYNIQVEQSDGSVTATCVSHHSGGHSESSAFTIPIDKEAYMNDAQKTASAMTYAKRYSFCNAFGIMTADEDDDAKGADPEHAAGSDRNPDEKKGDPKEEPAQPQSSGRTVTDHMESIKHHFDLFAEAYGADRAPTELLNATEFQGRDGSMVAGFETLEAFRAWIQSHDTLKQCAARIRVICHKMEESYQNALKNEGGEQ